MIYNTTQRIPDKISALGLGTWNFGGGFDGFDKKASIAVVHAALDAGINIIDTAALYGHGQSEEILGEAIADRRSQVFLATKGGRPFAEEGGPAIHDLSKQNLLDEVDQSLARLKTDTIDLYQLHWPDPNTPLEQTAHAIETLRACGKVRYVGLSNFSAEDAKTLSDWVGIDSQQGLYNMLERNSIHYRSHTLSYRTEQEIFPLVREYGQAFFPFVPLFQGLLAGRFLQGRDFSSEDERASNPKLSDEQYPLYERAVFRLNELAQTVDKPLVQLSLNWLMHQQEITSVIFGASTPKQVQTNVESLQWELSPSLQNAIDEIIKPFETL